MITVYRVFI